MEPSITKIQDYKATVQFLWAQGLKDSAREFEKAALNKGVFSVGSCHTEEVLEKFITNDPEMIKLKDTVRKICNIEDPVLISGESGTGKEIIANALHGSRVGKFVPINCPALSVDLMESELFGHKKGSFTGALEDKVGKFQYAFNGTLFIDEIGDMPSSMQAAILRVLQEKVITRVGDNEEIKVKCRIVCATNKDLGKMVESGMFRLDLLQRLITFELKTTPLRIRPQDIGWIAGKINPKFKWMGLVQKEFPGNVRELQRIIRRWEILGEM